MAVTNNAMLIRRELMTRLAKMLNEGTIEQEIDRIPIEMRPRYSETSRCCIHKDRAVIKYKLMALLGFNIEDEEDELTPLSEYARMASARGKKSSSTMLTVVDEACSSCVKANYVVTNMCRGCVARPCTMNCNKDAIVFVNGQAIIDSTKCVNCGLCQKVCPFHAIIYQPVPCEESCPVGAITKDELGIERINKSKCINCGKCVVACPFGAVMEKTHFAELYRGFKSSRKVVAMVAPAIAGQFKVPMEKIMGAFKELGFDDVVEVAVGADITSQYESEEFLERMGEGAPFMTTSCCPAYVNLVDRHIPELKPFVSHTKSPMYYTAELARQKYPDGILVMVAPCTGKRHEAFYDPNVDLVISFEEFGALMVAHGVEITGAEPENIDKEVTNVARGFGYSGGVTNAVLAYAPTAKVEPVVINGIDKSQIRALKQFPKSCPGNFVEVMSCEGGCVGGCNVIANPKIALRQIDELMKRSKVK
jgi:[FeFe] hydrogenase (group B1/B3)